MDNKKIKYRISSDGIVVNQHFGRASLFGIFNVLQDNTIQLTETREVVPLCEAGEHESKRMLESVKRLSDCKYVLVSRIGQSAVSVLEQEGIIPIELPGIIEESVQKLITYEEIQNLFT
jgi:Uncharacterized conserved protein